MLNVFLTFLLFIVLNKTNRKGLQKPLKDFLNHIPSHTYTPPFN